MQFGLISLHNVVHEILSNILVNWLRPVLLSLKSFPRSNLHLPKVELFFTIITAYEYLNFMRANGTKRNRSFALKLDMSKAYHQVEWPYVFAISWKGWDSARDGFI